MKANKEYAANDFSSTLTYYADNAKYWQSGMKDFVSLDEAMKMWKNDFDNFDDIKMKQVGYPDLLHYKKRDKWTVQSYWEWSGKSKKSGEVETIMIVMFDEINKDGKIAREYNVGDFSKVN